MTAWFDMTAWFEGKDKKGKWFLANPRFVNYDNPEKVNPPKSLDLRMDKNLLLYAALGDVRNHPLYSEIVRYSRRCHSHCEERS